MTRMRHLVALGVVAAALLSACGDDDGAAPAGSVGTTASSELPPPTSGEAAPTTAPATTTRPTVAAQTTAAPTTAAPTTTAAPAQVAAESSEPVPIAAEGSAPETVPDEAADCFGWFSVIEDEASSLPFQYLAIGDEIAVDQAGAFTSNADATRSIEWLTAAAAEDAAAWAEHWDALAASSTFTQELHDSEIALAASLAPWCGIGG